MSKIQKRKNNKNITIEVKHRKKKSGFADTKKYPHRGHPSYYKKNGKDEIEYLTFTHHPNVELKGKSYTTIPLNKNIDPKKRNSEVSYVYPKIFEGKRSALGKERTDLSFDSNDKIIVEHLFKELPHDKVRYSSKSKKK